MIERSASQLHLAIEFFLPGVAKWRMADVVRQRQSLGQIVIQSKKGSYRSRHLRHFHRVGQTVTEMVRDPGREDLGLVFQTAKRSGMHDAIAVSLEVIAIGMRELGITPSAAATNRESQLGKRLEIHAKLPGCATLHVLAHDSDNRAAYRRAIQRIQRFL